MRGFSINICSNNTRNTFFPNTMITVGLMVLLVMLLGCGDGCCGGEIEEIEE